MAGKMEGVDTMKNVVSIENEISSVEKYVIDVPSFWTKEDLLDLKEYLTTLRVGTTPVWIRIHGTEKSTKFSIEDINELKTWLQKK